MSANLDISWACLSDLLFVVIPCLLVEPTALISFSWFNISQAMLSARESAYRLPTSPPNPARTDLELPPRGHREALLGQSGFGSFMIKPEMAHT